MKIGVYTFHEGKEPKDLKNEIKKLIELIKQKFINSWKDGEEE